MSREDGTIKIPVTIEYPLRDNYITQINGDVLVPAVSLRDYFAAAALTGIISVWKGPMAGKEVSEAAYGFADAMLQARKEGGDEL